MTPIEIHEWKEQERSSRTLERAALDRRIVTGLLQRLLALKTMTAMYCLCVLHPGNALRLNQSSAREREMKLSLGCLVGGHPSGPGELRYHNKMRVAQ